MLQNPEVSAGLMDHLALMETFTFYLLQARIQDFEMGGEFSPPQSEKSNIIYQILFQYLRDKKKIRKQGAQKKGGGGENSTISAPLDPHLFYP